MSDTLRCKRLAAAYGLSLYQIAFSDPSWNASTFDLHRDSAVLDRNPAAINATDPNLAPFKQSGGKLIQWHSWDDSQFMPGTRRGITSRFQR